MVQKDAVLQQAISPTHVQKPSSPHTGNHCSSVPVNFPEIIY